MDEFASERALRREEKSKDLGFSSVEEYDQHMEERWRRNSDNHQKMLDEKCARLGKTRKQLE